MQATSNGRRSTPLRRVARLVAAVMLAYACTRLPSDPTEIFSLTFEPLPSPSVVSGDSLRDTLGVATPVMAHAYNSDGDELDPGTVRFLVADTGMAVDSVTGHLVAGPGRKYSVRLHAYAGSLQSPSQTIFVTSRPDIVVATDTAWLLEYALGDTLAVSPELGVKLYHGEVHPDSAVQAYLVSFQIVSPVDTGSLWLTNVSRQRSHVDTTGADGAAQRNVAVRTEAILANAIDSIVVEAMVRYKGAPVSGSPVRLLLRVKPRS
jgi:hypothetical protein